MFYNLNWKPLSCRHLRIRLVVFYKILTTRLKFHILTSYLNTQTRLSQPHTHKDSYKYSCRKILECKTLLTHYRKLQSTFSRVILLNSLSTLTLSSKYVFVLIYKCKFKIKIFYACRQVIFK